MTIKKSIIIPTVLFSMVAGYGIAQMDIFNSPDAATITETQAREAALKTFQGTVTEISYDLNDRVPHYDVEIVGTTEKVDIEVNAATGVATITQREKVSSQTTAQATSAKITETQAKDAALKLFAGTITSFSYDYDDRVPHYDIEITGTTEKVDIEVNATTGGGLITEREMLRSQTATTATNSQSTTQTRSQQVTTNNTQASTQQTSTSNQQEVTNKAQASSQQATTNNTQTTSTQRITEAQARAAALKVFSGTITSIEYDHDDRVPHYDIEIRGTNEKVDVHVNAASGVATITERETIRNHTNTATTNTQATTSNGFITRDQAIAIAQQRASGTVSEVELDDNKYEITIRNGRTEHDFEINARTGVIISYETDYDD